MISFGEALKCRLLVGFIVCFLSGFFLASALPIDEIIYFDNYGTTIAARRKTTLFESWLNKNDIAYDKKGWEEFGG